MSRRACHSNQIVYPCLPTVYRYILCSYGPQRSLLRQRCTCVELHHSFAKKTVSRLSKKKYLPFGNLICQKIILHLQMMLWCSFESAFFLVNVLQIFSYSVRMDILSDTIKKTENNLELPFSGHHFFQPSFGSSFHVPLQCPGVIFHRRTALFLEDALAVLTHCFPSEDHWKSPLKSVTKIWKNQIWIDLDVEWCWMTLKLNDVDPL